MKGKCATIGCQNEATHELAYSFPESRGTTAHDKVCESCGDGYVSRPSLLATLTPLKAF